ncbi:MAG: hypothetical protein Q8R79_05305 [Legionellaceae bacterium]|nr:hypothetical protein [Legionellaceae bacterium]
MPAKTQITYQVQVAQETEAHVDNQQPAEGFQVWGLPEWQAHIEKNPTLLSSDKDIDPALASAKNLWNACFGNRVKSQYETDNNPIASFLTDSAAKQILAYPHLFQHGIDFQHLPAGFTRISDPKTGVRNLIHYNPHLIPYQKHKLTPLHIPMTEEDMGKNLPALNLDEPAQSWYDILQEKNKISDTKTYCSAEALRKSFLYFSEFLKSQNLSFYTLSDSQKEQLLRQDCHPILLLARWKTMLSHGQLQAKDKDDQWKALPYLHLYSGSTAIRLITDHQWSSTPRGFVLLPEMQTSFDAAVIQTEKMYIDLDNQFDQKHRNMQWYLKSHNHKPTNGTSDEEDRNFWLCVAMQSKRRSIAFYKKILKKMDELFVKYLEIGLHDKSTLLTLLVTSTTASNFHMQDPEEQAESLYWTNFIDILLSYGNKLGLEELRILIGHIDRFNGRINSFMLYSTADYIQNFVKELFKQPWKLIGDPLKPLRDLSDEQNEIIAKYSSAYYQGAKAFHPNHTWEDKLDVSQYVKLQYHLFKKIPQLSPLLIGHFSLFKAYTPEAADEFYTKILPYEKNEQLLTLLTLFEHCKAPQDLKPGELLAFIETFCQASPQGIEAITEKLCTAFPQQFEEAQVKKVLRNLLAEKTGLLTKERAAIQNAEFPDTLKPDLILLLSSCYRNSPPTDPLTRKESFRESLQVLQNLQNALDQKDFSKLIHILNALPDADLKVSPVVELLKTLGTLKNLEGLHQIHQCYLRLAKEKKPKLVLSRYKIYLDQIKPLLQKTFKDAPHVHQHRFAETLATLVLQNPQSDSVKIIDYLVNFSKDHPNTQDYVLNTFENIASEDLSTLMAYDWLPKLPAELVFTFFAQYHESPSMLLELLAKINKFAETQRQPLLDYISQLINNQQPIDDLASFLESIHSNLNFKEMKTFIIEDLSSPPLPDIPTLNQKKSASQQELKQWYSGFSLQPFGKRIAEYQFNKAHFLTQKTLFEYYAASSPDAAKIFTDKIGENFQNFLADNQKSTLEVLHDKLKGTDSQERLCALIELLARTTPQIDPKNPKNTISQELNTSQIMALWAIIHQQESASKILSQIDTGEGKSRIMIVLAAYQALQGKTVDLLTSDLSLSERDYRQYQAFFSRLKIPSSLVTLHTPAHFYRAQGVNFSTNDTLSLLRHKSEVDGTPFAYLDKNAKNRCLLIDEVDALIDLDSSSKNYATENPALAPFVWIYPRLMSFIAEKFSAEDLESIFKNPDIDVEKLFLKYLDSTHPEIEDLARLKVLQEQHPKQIGLWLHSAAKATQMKKEVDYTIAENTIAVFDKKGATHYISPIQVLKNGRVVEGSTYRDGVHQCLCAREILAAEKAQEEHALLIQPETRLKRSSYAINTVDHYQEGTIIGCSGTPSLMGKKESKTNPSNFFCVRVPREKATRREDLPPILAKDFKQQMEYLKKAIRTNINLGEPITLVTRDDVQTQQILVALQKDPFFTKSGFLKDYSFQHLTAKSSKKAVESAIQQAGQLNTLTIGTAGMLGRGVDINAKRPLAMYCLFEPETAAEELQIRGRSGRFGERGSYRMILNQQDVLAPVPRTRNLEKTLQERQQQHHKLIDKQRTIVETIARFQESMHELWFKNHADTADEWTKWEEVLEGFQKDTLGLEDSLEDKPIEDWEPIFTAFTQKWLDAFVGIFPQKDLKTDMQQTKQQTQNTLQTASGYLKNIGKHYPKISKKPKTQKQYDIADDGQNKIYSTPFAQTRATLFGSRPFFANTRAAREGRGQRFAETRAFFAGERPIFANSRAFLERIMAWLRSIVKSDVKKISTPSTSPKKN